MRRLRRTGLPALVAAVSFAIGAASALADGLLSGTVYDNGSQCVENQTFMSRTYNSARVTSLTDSWIYFPPLACTYNKPMGTLAARWESHKWGPNAQAWLLCGSQGWEFGNGTSFAVGRNVTGCGDGYYYVLGGTYVWNGGWVGGWLWHDYRWYDY